MWRWWWWKENDRNVAVMVNSFTIYEAVLKRKKVECRVDVGSMRGRCRVDVGSMWARCEVDVESLGGQCICGWKNM